MSIVFPRYDISMTYSDFHKSLIPISSRVSTAWSFRLGLLYHQKWSPYQNYAMSLNYRDLFVVNKQRPHPVISHFQLNQKSRPTNRSFQLRIERHSLFWYVGRLGSCSSCRWSIGYQVQCQWSRRVELLSEATFMVFRRRNISTCGWEHQSF